MSDLAPRTISSLGNALGDDMHKPALWYKNTARSPIADHTESVAPDAMNGVIFSVAGSPEPAPADNARTALDDELDGVEDLPQSPVPSIIEVEMTELNEPPMLHPKYQELNQVPYSTQGASYTPKPPVSFRDENGDPKPLHLMLPEDFQQIGWQDPWTDDSTDAVL